MVTTPSAPSVRPTGLPSLTGLTGGVDLVFFLQNTLLVGCYEVIEKCSRFDVRATDVAIGTLSQSCGLQKPGSAAGIPLVLIGLS